MRAGAQLSVTDLRRSARHPVNFELRAIHLPDSDFSLRIRNISTRGFMIDNAHSIARGDRMILDLPMMGRIEAYCMWLVDSRAGFQFERILRADKFVKMISLIQPNPALRPRRGLLAT